MIGIFLDPVYDYGKGCTGHLGLRALASMAETTGEITAISDLDIYFFEFFQAVVNRP